MGLFDFIQDTFVNDREDDFVPLDNSDDDTFGPGPLILMYAVPDSMDDEELRDMVEDGMSRRAKEGVAIRRISGMDGDGEGGDELLDSTVEEALTEAAKTPTSTTGPPIVAPAKQMIPGQQQTPCPVLYFSGVSNAEMMDTYRIVANEIYEETAGVHWPACAKVVPPAMGKSLRQVLTEISGDHADAMKMRKEEAEGGDNES